MRIGRKKGKTHEEGERPGWDWVLQPHGGMRRFPPGSSTLLAGSPPVPLSACRAEVCRLACICKMWARRAGRRNFPLKRLIFQRNEARAGEQEQRAGPVSSLHAWISEIQIILESLYLPFEQTWYKQSRDLTLRGNN